MKPVRAENEHEHSIFEYVVDRAFPLVLAVIAIDGKLGSLTLSVCLING